MQNKEKFSRKSRFSCAAFNPINLLEDRRAVNRTLDFLLHRGQIQMFETIAVLLVFMFILAFGLGFYFFIAKAGAAREQARIEQSQAIESAQRLTTLPELDCVKGGVVIERCVDLYKIRALKDLLADDEALDYYFNTFGYTHLVIRRVYPDEETFELYHRPSPRDSGSTFTQVPILIYNPVEDLYSFGVVEVRRYD